jgi:DNA-binding MarR family transcriptional regulator
MTWIREISVNQALDLESAFSQNHARLRLWLRLLTATKLVETEIRARLIQSFGVTLPQFDLLAQLEKSPDGLTMGELSARMMVSTGNVTGIVDRLVKEGLVDRNVSDTDKRSFRVSLTRKGIQKFRTYALAHEEWVDEILGEMNPRDSASLMTLLAKVKQTARAAKSRK